jgi:hypothetical protein
VSLSQAADHFHFMSACVLYRSVVPVRRGYWGNKIGKPHTVPTKTTGKCGSVTVRLERRSVCMPFVMQLQLSVG